MGVRLEDQKRLLYPAAKHGLLTKPLREVISERKRNPIFRVLAHTLSVQAVFDMIIYMS